MKYNLKFYGGMLLVIAFLIQCLMQDIYRKKIDRQIVAIESHQYLAIITRLQMLNYKFDGFPNDKGELQKIGAFVSQPLSHILNGAFLNDSEKDKLQNKIKQLHKKIVDFKSYSEFHEKVVALDSKYGQRTLALKKRYENIEYILLWIFNLLYLIGIALIGFGEFKRTKLASSETNKKH